MVMLLLLILVTIISLSRADNELVGIAFSPTHIVKCHGSPMSCSSFVTMVQIKHACGTLYMSENTYPNFSMDEDGHIYIFDYYANVYKMSINATNITECSMYAPYSVTGVASKQGIAFGCGSLIVSDYSNDDVIECVGGTSSASNCTVIADISMLSYDYPEYLAFDPVTQTLFSTGYSYTYGSGSILANTGTPTPYGISESSLYFTTQDQLSVKGMFAYPADGVLYYVVAEGDIYTVPIEREQSQLCIEQFPTGQPSGAPSSFPSSAPSLMPRTYITVDYELDSAINKTNCFPRSTGYCNLRSAWAACGDVTGASLTYLLMAI